MNKLNTKRQQAAVDAWNAKHPIGTSVKYWRGARGRAEAASEVGPMSSPAELLGGHTPVVWIEGCSGAIALSHVEAIDEPITIRKRLEHFVGVLTAHGLDSPQEREVFDRYAADEEFAAIAELTRRLAKTILQESGTP